MEQSDSTVTMEEKAVEIIDALAENLGVAAGHLWEVLVTQGFIEGVIASTFLAGLLLLAFIFYVAFYYLWNRLNDSELSYRERDRVEIPFYFTFSFGILYLFFLPFLLYSLVTTAITGLMNPEFLAIQTLLEGLK